MIRCTIFSVFGASLCKPSAERNYTPPSGVFRCALRGSAISGAFLTRRPSSGRRKTGRKMQFSAREGSKMAIYFCRMSVVSAGGKRSAVASAAYQADEKIKRDLDGKTRNFQGRHGDTLGPTGILLPDNAPEKFEDRAVLWNDVERFESAKMGPDARFCRDWIFALPKEIPPEMQEQLVRQFCKEQFTDRGMIADFAIHRKPGNHHIHVKTTCRPLDENGQWIKAKSHKVYNLDADGNRIPVLDADGNQRREANGKRIWKSHKVTVNDWDSVKTLNAIRAGWSKTANEFLQKIGSMERIDHRSYKEQGLPICGQMHLGPACAALERRGVQTLPGLVNGIIVRNNKELMQQFRQDLPWKLDERIAAATNGIAAREAEIKKLEERNDVQAVPEVVAAREKMQEAQVARDNAAAEVDAGEQEILDVKAEIKAMRREGRPDKFWQFLARDKYDEEMKQLEHNLKKLERKTVPEMRGALIDAETALRSATSAYNSVVAKHTRKLTDAERQRIATLKREIKCLRLIKKHAQHSTKIAARIQRGGKATEAARAWASRQAAPEQAARGGGGGGGSVPTGGSRSASDLLDRLVGDNRDVAALAGKLGEEDRNNGLDDWKLLSEVAKGDKNMEQLFASI